MLNMLTSVVSRAWPWYNYITMNSLFLLSQKTHNSLRSGLRIGACVHIWWQGAALADGNPRWEWVWLTAKKPNTALTLGVQFGWTRVVTPLPHISAAPSTKSPEKARHNPSLDAQTICRPVWQTHRSPSETFVRVKSWLVVPRTGRNLHCSSSVWSSTIGQTFLSSNYSKLSQRGWTMWPWCATPLTLLQTSKQCSKGMSPMTAPQIMESLAFPDRSHQSLGLYHCRVV